MTSQPGAVRTSPGLTLAYLGTAALAFVVAAAGVPWLAPELAGHYYQPRVLALTHTVTLGWITLTIMGASYQLAPIVFQRPVWSVRLARVQLTVMVVGVSGMIAHFFIGEWSGLVWGAAFVTLGVVAHVVNFGMTLRGVRPWTFTATMFAVALGGITATTAAGLALGVDRLVPFVPLPFYPRLHAHFHLAVLGWIMPMVFGVGAHVYPLFLRAAAPGRAWQRVQAWGLVCGVPLIVTGAALSASVVTIAGALAVTTAVAAHLAALSSMVRTRKSPLSDCALSFVLTGAALLAPATALGLGFALDVIGGPRLGLAYAALVLGGWVSLTIVGVMLKIVPFLVWYRVYAPLAGRGAVPTLAELSWPRAERGAHGLLAAGIVSLTGALAVGDPRWIRPTGWLVAAGALALALTVAAALSHLVRRRVSQPAAGHTAEPISGSSPGSPR